jgi:hypothetical protein
MQVPNFQLFHSHAMFAVKSIDYGSLFALVVAWSLIYGLLGINLWARIEIPLFIIR